MAFLAPEVIFNIRLRAQEVTRVRVHLTHAIETTRHSFFDNETFFVFILYYVKI